MLSWVFDVFLMAKYKSKCAKKFISAHCGWGLKIPTIELGNLWMVPHLSRATDSHESSKKKFDIDLATKTANILSGSSLCPRFSSLSLLFGWAWFNCSCSVTLIWSAVVAVVAVVVVVKKCSSIQRLTSLNRRSSKRLKIVGRKTKQSVTKKLTLKEIWGFFETRY